jgi:hypothetical protein
LNAARFRNPKFLIPKTPDPMLTRKTILFVLTSVATAAAPGLAPAIPLAGAVIRVSPAVREIVGRLRRIEVPSRFRQRNWTGRRGEGSCVHASMVHLLHWQGRHELAASWRARYADGETAFGLAEKLESARIEYAETRDGDASFLEWALRTLRGVNVVVRNGTHMVTLAGLDQSNAVILDSNSPDRLETMPRSEFLDDWKRSGGWAVTPLGVPPSPAPWLVESRSKE